MKQSFIGTFIYFGFPLNEVKSWIALPHAIAAAICIGWLVLLSYVLSSLIHSFQGCPFSLKFPQLRLILVVVLLMIFSSACPLNGRLSMGAVAHFFFLKFCLKNTEIQYMTNQEKAYISLQKYLLSLQHKLTRYSIAGLKPPEYLLERFEQTKRRLRIFSKAREKQ